MTISVDFTDARGNYYLYLSVSSDEIGLPADEVWLINGKVITDVIGSSKDVR